MRTTARPTGLAALTSLTALSVPLVLWGAEAAPPGPPATAEHDVVRSYHGKQVHDPYRWLEQADAPEVGKWIDAQNAYADGIMSAFRDQGAIVKRVGQLALTSTQRSDPEIAGNMLFYMRQTPPQPQAVLVSEPRAGAAARVLVDTNASQGNSAITNYWPSADGRQVAYGVAEGGTESTTIHFVDVASGKVAADALPYAGGGTTPQALAWDADGKGVTYVRLPLPGTVPEARSQFDAQLFHHTLGTPASADTAALGKPPSPIAEHRLVSSAHGERAAAFIYYGDGNYGNVYLRSGKTWRKVLGTEAKVSEVTTQTGGWAWDGARLLLISSEGAPRGKLIALDEAGHVSTVLPEQDWTMSAVAPVKGGLLLVEVNGPDWRVQQFDTGGKLVRTLALPASGIGINAIASSEDYGTAIVAYSGWSVPSRWAKYDSTTGTLSTVFEVKPAADYSKVHTWRLDAPSAGGVRVPVTVIALGDIEPNGHRPTILTAYGGYGLNIEPAFIGSNLAWLERGGVYAVANIRGGGELGDNWHQDGSRGNKQHSFDDLHAAAQALLSAHWTDHEHLGILGGSNGGLLMGGALTQHPDDYRAVGSAVGIYDMLRSELWPNGEYNTHEYGTVKDATEFGWLYGYSPLHHVRANTAYPAVLLLTGENDPRVAPWQSRKFAAALQKANTSKQPILLLTRRNEGHGVTSSFSQRVGNRGALLSFFAEELSLPPAAVAPAAPAPH
jgi:prolyl oligopeptidase